MEFVERRLVSVGIQGLQLGQRLVHMALAHFRPGDDQRRQKRVESALGQRLNARLGSGPMAFLHLLLDNQDRCGRGIGVETQQPLGHLTGFVQLPIRRQSKMGALQHLDLVRIRGGGRAQESGGGRQVVNVERQAASHVVAGRGIGAAIRMSGFSDLRRNLLVGRAGHYRDRNTDDPNGGQHSLAHTYNLTRTNHRHRGLVHISG